MPMKYRPLLFDFSVLLMFLTFNILDCHAKNSFVKFITFNLRYDNKGDGINCWDNRKDRVINFVKDETPDVICFQEVLKRQLDELDDFLDDYAYVGVGRDDGKTHGEYAPVFIK